jgi:hypothetical protein
VKAAYGMSLPRLPGLPGRRAFLVPETRNPAASPAFDDANSSHWQISMTR